MSDKFQIVGKSKHAEELRRHVTQLCANRKDVLITGEAGVGKTTVAISIAGDEDVFRHPFAESGELALEKVLVEATQGTLIVEGLELSSFRSQVALLQVLARRPKGLRFIITAGSSLEELLQQGKLVDGLHAHLSLFEEMHILPLRERPEDIPPLVKHFAEGLAIDINALETLVKHPWKENIRQLKSVVDCCISGAVDGKFELPEDLIDERTEVVKMVARLIEDPKPALDKSLDLLEGTIIARTLERFGFNESKAAQFLGISERTFGQKIRRLALAHPGLR